MSRGTRVGRVSSEWFSRPDDERFLSLGDLAGAVRGRSERSRTRVVESALIHVEANRHDPIFSERHGLAPPVDAVVVTKRDGAVGSDPYIHAITVGDLVGLSFDFMFLRAASVSMTGHSSNFYLQPKTHSSDPEKTMLLKMLDQKNYRQGLL